MAWSGKAPQRNQPEITGHLSEKRHQLGKRAVDLGPWPSGRRRRSVYGLHFRRDRRKSGKGRSRANRVRGVRHLLMLGNDILTTVWTKRKSREADDQLDDQCSNPNQRSWWLIPGLATEWEEVIRLRMYA